MDSYAPQIAKMIKKFRKLPGVGNKTAQNFAYALASGSEKDASEFAEAVLALHRELRRCPECQNLTDRDVCPICASPVRDRSTVLVVEHPQDIVSFECSGAYSGLYHVLYGAVDQKNGIGLKDITAEELVLRAKNHPEIKEIIFALNQTYEGETTADMLMGLFAGSGIKVSKIGRGIPSGAEIGRTDAGTLGYALCSRTDDGGRPVLPPETREETQPALPSSGVKNGSRAGSRAIDNLFT